jgi:hypothetical protein
MEPPEEAALAGLASLPPGVGCTPASNAWINATPGQNNQVGYYRDPFGSVHLQGIATKCGAPPAGDIIFTLPAGYRPDELNTFGTLAGNGLGRVGVDELGQVQRLAGNVDAQTGGWIYLESLSFRCTPSGQNGCP